MNNNWKTRQYILLFIQLKELGQEKITEKNRCTDSRCGEKQQEQRI